MDKKNGFTLIELLVVITILGVISVFVMVMLGKASATARDARRKTELMEMTKFFVQSCYMPLAGPGTHDLAEILAEVRERYPQNTGQINTSPLDPKIGTLDDSYYRYMIAVDGKKCILYANLELEDNAVSLAGVTAPTPGKGTGVLKMPDKGWNGSTKYFQVSI